MVPIEQSVLKFQQDVAEILRSTAFEISLWTQVFLPCGLRQSSLRRA